MNSIIKKGLEGMGISCEILQDPAELNRTSPTSSTKLLLSPPHPLREATEGWKDGSNFDMTNHPIDCCSSSRAGTPLQFQSLGSPHGMIATVQHSPPSLTRIDSDEDETTLRT